jgi:Uma2 family endonuclease
MRRGQLKARGRLKEGRALSSSMQWRERLTQHLKVIALEPDGLVHVLEEPSWRSDEDIHPREPVRLVLEVLASDDETGRERVVGSDLPENLEDLDSL